MKRTLNQIVICTVLAAGSGPLAAQETRVIRDAPSNQEMLMQFRKAQEASAKRAEPAAAVSQSSSQMKPADNLLDRAAFISFGGTMTMVPKGAIIEISEAYADRLRRTAGARLMDFPAFAAANRSWLSTYEVSFVQAQGKQPINEDAKAHMKKNGNVVVATFRGNPIEVLPPVETPAATDSPISTP
jgi:hypothetical protein